MQGRLRSITLQSSQEAWKLDLTEIPAPAAAAAATGGHGHPEAPPHRVPISTSRVTSRTAGQIQNIQKRGASSSEHIVDNDDDDFMPPNKQHACTRAASSVPRTNIRRSLGASTTVKPPSVRCDPSIVITLMDHLNMHQRRKISELGFGGLLQFSADGMGSTDLLVYLMDKLNPETMTLEVGNEGGLKINEICVQKVLGLPIGDSDLPSSTEEENATALDGFKKSLRIESQKDVKCSDLLKLVQKLKIDNVLAVRIFFVVAFNKLLFPALDKHIRGQDAFMTKDLSNFGNLNWCKAVVHELCHAAITWRSETKKSIPGCGIFLIIFYLDNLDSRTSIDHFTTPRAKYFHSRIIERLINEDKRRDRAGNVTYGNLQLKNIANTCYQFIEPCSNGLPAAAKSSSLPLFPSADEIGVLLNEMTRTSSRNKATDSLKKLAANASHAINIIQSGSTMLFDAHKEFIHTMRSVIEEAPVQMTTRDHATCDKGPATENVSRTNQDSSFSYDVVPCINSAASRSQTVPSHLTGNETCTVPAAHIPKAHEENEKHVNGEPCGSVNLHNVVSNEDLDRAAHPAPCVGQEDKQCHWESVVNSTPFRMAPELGSFAPDFDKILEDVNEFENIATDHVDHVNQDVNKVSNDKFIPDATAEGGTDPNTPMHIDHFNPLHHSRSKSVENQLKNTSTIGEAPTLNHLQSVPQNQEHDGPGDASLEMCTMATTQCDPTNTRTFHPYNDKAVYDHISLFAATQDDSGYCIRARPRIDRFVNVPMRYRSPFKCMSPRPPIDMIKAQAVRTKFCTELKEERSLVIHAPDNWFTCKDVADTFSDGGLIGRPFMDFFVNCLRAEEMAYRPNCVGFRVFFSGYLGEMLNQLEERQHAKNSDLAALIKLEADLVDLDIFKIKIFFVPIPENNYYTVYCLNMVDSRIDILDSSNEDHEDYHAVVGDRVVPRLNDLFNKLTHGKFKDFSRWKRPVIKVMRETVPNDSAFIAMKVMQIWDGNKLHSKETQVVMSELRSEILYYMLYNSVNQVQKLPYGLDDYRPLK